jgi:2-polyprenyl-3-methyl-5-hydroxy-6-metoxy-1,4-benzoquinol methylase
VNKQVVRLCPICEEAVCEILHRQKFVLPQGHPLTAGYDVVCCNRCGFVYADTTVSQADYDRFYAEFSKYEDRLTSTGGGDVPWDAERLAATAAYVAEFLPDRRARILDIGCANGGLLRALRDLGWANVVGIDPSAACVENTSRLHGIEAYVAWLSAIPVGLGQFDCVILSHVLEHVSSLQSAAHSLGDLVRPGGIAYVETPDATRYVEFVTAPFQDFNTEHINHFSPRCLANLFGEAGWVARTSGQKVILSAPQMPYPALYTVFARDAGTALGFSLTPDVELHDKIRAYIARSQTTLDEIATTIQAALCASPELIVWGTGQLAMKLLAETPLGEAQIVAFVDSNPINQGRLLRGVPILAPDAIRGMPQPILVASTLHQDEIVDVIRFCMGLTNSLILLSSRTNA